MIWTQRSTLRPLAGAAFLAAGIVASMAEPGAQIPPVSGSFSVTSGAPVGSFSGRTAKFGGVHGRGQSIFERQKLHAVDGEFRVERSGPQMRFTGSVHGPYLGSFAIVTSRHAMRARGKVDLTPVIEEENFLLGYLLGDDE